MRTLSKSILGTLLIAVVATAVIAVALVQRTATSPLGNDQARPPAALAAGAAGPSLRPDATPEPTEDTTSENPEAANPGDVTSSRFDRCTMVVQSYDMVDDSIEFAMQWADAVVVGTVEAIGEGRFNTPGDALAASDPVTPLDVYRPTNIRIDTVLRGDIEPSGLAVRLPGGHVGCDEYAPDSSEGVVGGARYLFFLSKFTDAKGNTVDELTVTASWSLTDDGRVSTPYDGKVSIDELTELANNLDPIEARPVQR